ncbi:MAG: gliding motility-associated C-terminal domain-containing protein, partial [Bacteroidetes bacterium]|nr:gliding motility-associated C-terminal domain-containing protein [Bacteroidota bacterium]
LVLNTTGILSHPGQFVVRNDNGNWYMLVCNTGENSISRLSFGKSLLNQPAGENLGNVGSLDRVTGITLIEDCQSFTGFVTNMNIVSDALTRLKFPNGLAGRVEGENAGNTGTLSNPWKISEMMRQGDTIFALITNALNGSLSLLYFPGIHMVNPAGSTLENPPPVYYSSPGTYTIMLTVNTGDSTEQQVCRQIVVIPGATVNLGNDKIICPGSDVILDAGDGFASYTWNNGSTTRKIAVNQQGKYKVEVENAGGCKATDSVVVMVASALQSTVDTTICSGERYFAGNQWRYTSGTYVDYFSSVLGCDSIVTTILVVKPPVAVPLGKDSVICPGDHIELSVHLADAVFTWQDRSHDSLFTVVQPGKYWVTAIKDGCSGSDTIVINDCPPGASAIWIPNAFSPDGDAVNDTFKATCHNIIKFRMMIFDKWGAIVFDSNDLSEGWNGQSGGTYYPSGVYVFRIDYEGAEAPGESRIQTGTLMLVR